MPNSLVGQCEWCCGCPSPYLAFVTRAASKSKCGFESAGTWYLTSTVHFTSSQSYSDSNPFDSVASCSLSVDATTVTNVDAATCASTCDAGLTTGTASSSITIRSGTVGTSTAAATWSCAGLWTGTTTSPSGVVAPFTSPLPPNYCNTLGAPTTTTTTTYANEYTTSMLEGFVMAALPDWASLPPPSSATSGGITLASEELAADGSSYSISQGKYQFAHQVPAVGGYKITWVETTIPDVGSPSNTAKSYEWDGVTPDDYDPSDPSTWPTSPLFEIDSPGTNGIVQLNDITYFCKGSPADGLVA